MSQKPIMFTVVEYINGRCVGVVESSNYTGHIPRKGDQIAVTTPSLIHKSKSAYTVTDVQFFYTESCQLEAVALVVEFLKFVPTTKR